MSGNRNRSWFSVGIRVEQPTSPATWRSHAKIMIAAVSITSILSLVLFLTIFSDASLWNSYHPKKGAKIAEPLTREEWEKSNKQLLSELAVLSGELETSHRTLRTRVHKLVLESDLKREPKLQINFTKVQSIDISVKGHVLWCLDLEKVVKEEFKKSNEAWQTWIADVREARWRSMIGEHVVWLESQREYWSKLKSIGVNSTKSATYHLFKIKKPEEKEKHERFLSSYLPNQKWWKEGDSMAAKRLTKWVKRAQSWSQKRLEDRLAAEKAAMAAETQLWDECRLRIVEIPQKIKPMNSTRKSPKRVDPGVRVETRPPSREASWKKDPNLYPDPTLNVTFMLQYYKQPEMIKTIVKTLYSCTRGLSGTGQLPGLTSELLVNVDEPSAFREWHDAWKRTDGGSFVVPVFSHNIHENRGYNNLVNMARGRVVFLMQDDDTPPRNCSWLTRVLKIYEAWPKVGVVGLKTGRISTVGGVWTTLQAWLRPGRDPLMNPLFDPRTGVRMYFASVVDVGPMAFLRDLWQEMGGYDESYCRPGESCIVADWQLTFRVWLAGYQVVHMFAEPGYEWDNYVEGGTHKAGYGLSTRGTNLWVNTESYDRTYWEYDDILVREVKRLNGLLRPVPMWGT